jgi:DNA-directed RNA polymerase subunit RPC12/RpoP
MPEYNFSCGDCKNDFSCFWSIKSYDDSLAKLTCEKCGSKKVFRDYQEDNMVVSYHEVKTIGQLAEKNTKKMGRYELEEKMRQDNMDLHKKNKEVSAKRRKINKMTPEQKHKYIMEGE